MTCLAREEWNREMISPVMAVWDYGGLWQGAAYLYAIKAVQRVAGSFFCFIKRQFSSKIVYDDGIEFLSYISYTLLDLANFVDAFSGA